MAPEGVEGSCICLLEHAGVMWVQISLWVVPAHQVLGAPGTERFPIVRRFSADGAEGFFAGSAEFLGADGSPTGDEFPSPTSTDGATSFLLIGVVGLLAAGEGSCLCS